MARRQNIPTWEGIVLISLCAIGALRVFLIGAAFPFFNNVDEYMHLDLALKYAQGHVPRKLEPYDGRTARAIALYGSPEFLSSGEAPPPPWSLPSELRERIVARSAEVWLARLNPESTQQPLYYIVAAGWYRFGAGLGMEGIRAFYWIRFLNIALLVLLIGVSYAFIRRLYPDDLFLRMGVPVLLAVFPQDTFFSINSDALSPLLFTVAFYSLLEVLRSDRPNNALCLGAGLSVALTFLDKLSNVAIIGVLVAVLFLRSNRKDLERKPLALLACAALMPISLWAARDWLIMGDPTGSAAKTHLMGWALKPPGEMWSHPLLTPRGLWFFGDELLKSFWRGEFFWHGQRLAGRAPVMELFYPASSVVFLSAAAVSLSKKGPHRDASRLTFLTLSSSVLLLAAISLAYDFGDCPYPSRSAPFMFSGRLIGGTLVPFLVLYLTGLETILSRLKAAWAPWAALAAIALALAGVQIWTMLDVFASAYNWFHLP
jgi:hypothetical protein